MVRTIDRHPFLIGDTSYWHHEWEECVTCGRMDRPDAPEWPLHDYHDEEVEAARRVRHPEHAAHEAMARGEAVTWRAGIGWSISG